MALTLKTPGVYIQELDAFGNSVVPVPTAVPAFIGFTEKAVFNGQNLLNKAVKIESLSDYETIFGKGKRTQYTLAKVDPTADGAPDPDFHLANGDGYTLTPVDGTLYYLYNSLRYFYQNGGGTAYIISVGTYGGGNTPAISADPFNNAMKLLTKEQEPTMLLIPDSLLFKDEADGVAGAGCYSLQGGMLNHCGDQQNRVAILDIFNGHLGLDDPTYNPIDNFRNQVAALQPKFFSYGAAYYPWLNSTIVQSTEVDYRNLDDASIKVVQDLLTANITAAKPNDKQMKEATDTIAKLAVAQATDDDGNVTPSDDDITATQNVVSAMDPDYKTIMATILQKMNLLPPSGAMAGVWTSTDNNRGVWKAPANVGVASTISPSVDIDFLQQQDLNVPLMGKSVCAIRPFVGEGTLVWGARTLDGNSNDWRYINVRRTMIFLEQSVKAAAKAYVFEPNVASTWSSVNGMISNFLMGVWKQGGLAGTKPADAFSVSVGLGSTMTSQDILEGIMRVTVKVAIVRPAEFIVITFQQQMQKS